MKHAVDRHPLANEDGSLLVFMVIAITVIALLAAGVYTFTAGSAYSELYSNNAVKANYLAESGGLFAVPPIYNDPSSSNSSITGSSVAATLAAASPYTVSAGEQFSLTFVSNNASTAVMQSTGIVNPNTWFAAKRTITYNITKNPFPSFSDPLTTTANVSLNTTASGNAVTISTTDSGMVSALSVKGAAASLVYKWSGYSQGGATGTAGSSLTSFKSASGGLLNYEMQVKIKEDSGQNYYMAGLSFRLNDNNTADTTIDDTFFGVSFYRAKCNPTKTSGSSKCYSSSSTPAWLYKGSTSSWSCTGGTHSVLCDDYAAFSPLTSTTGSVYVIFWKMAQGTYKLIGAHRVTAADNILNADNKLKAWSTLAVKVVEQYQGGTVNGLYKDDGSGLCWTTSMDHCLRSNLITVYVQGPCTNTNVTDYTCSGGTILYPLTQKYPAYTVNWSYGFIPVTWNSYSWQAQGANVTDAISSTGLSAPVAYPTTTDWSVFPGGYDSATYQLLSSAGLSANREEIGIHGFDRGSTDKQFFADFGINLGVGVGVGGISGSGGGQASY